MLGRSSSWGRVRRRIRHVVPLGCIVLGLGGCDSPGAVGDAGSRIVEILESRAGARTVYREDASTLERRYEYVDASLAGCILTFTSRITRDSRGETGELRTREECEVQVHVGDLSAGDAHSFALDPRVKPGPPIWLEVPIRQERPQILRRCRRLEAAGPAGPRQEKREDALRILFDGSDPQLVTDVGLALGAIAEGCAANDGG